MQCLLSPGGLRRRDFLRDAAAVASITGLASLEATPAQASGGLPRAPEFTVVRNAFVYTADAENTILPAGWLLIRRDRIVALGSEAEVRAALGGARRGVRVIDGDGFMVLPGFVNSHWHERLALAVAPQNPDDRNDPPGPFARGGNMTAVSRFLDNAYGLMGQLQPREALAIARYSLWTLLRSGTTCFGDLGSINQPSALAQATLELGLRGRVGLWASDGFTDVEARTFRRTRPARVVLDQLEEVVAAYQAHPSGRLRAAPTPAYVLNMSDELGKGIRHIADRYATQYATHLCALRNEHAAVQAGFGQTPVERMQALGLLDGRLLAADAAFADEPGFEAIVHAGCAITHSPNKYGALGESTISETRQIPRFIERGVAVSVSNAGEWPSGMIEAAKLAWLGHNEANADPGTVRPSAALAMATRIGAAGLHWDDQIGSLEVGKKADLVMVPTTEWRYLVASRPLERLLFAGSSGDVHTVMVDGRVLIDAGHTTFLNERRLRQEYLAAARAFHDRVLAHPPAFRGAGTRGTSRG